MERLTRRIDSGIQLERISESKKEYAGAGGPHYSPLIHAARSRLADYEDTGLTPEEITAAADRRHECKIDCLLQEYNKVVEKLKRYEAAEQAGKLIAFPFLAMVEQSLQDGEMKPQHDQKHNGRYAVVYSAPERWGCPLIDICGTAYNSDQATARLEELKETEGSGNV